MWYQVGSFERVLRHPVDVFLCSCVIEREAPLGSESKRYDMRFMPRVKSLGRIGGRVFCLLFDALGLNRHVDKGVSMGCSRGLSQHGRFENDVRRCFFHTHKFRLSSRALEYMTVAFGGTVYFLGQPERDKNGAGVKFEKPVSGVSVNHAVHVTGGDAKRMSFPEDNGESMLRYVPAKFCIDTWHVAKDASFSFVVARRDAIEGLARRTARH